MLAYAQTTPPAQDTILHDGDTTVEMDGTATETLAGEALGENSSDAAFDAISADVDTYVRANVVDDATFATAPEVGVVVDDTVTLVPVEGFDAYSYTYFEGRPVVVQNDTRAVVWLGD